MEEGDTVYLVISSSSDCDCWSDDVEGVYSARWRAEQAMAGLDKDDVRIVEFTLDTQPEFSTVGAASAVTMDDGHEAYVALVSRVGEAAAIARVRKFQDVHHLNYGDPIGPRQDYIDALNDDDYDPDRPIPPTEEGMKRYPYSAGCYEGKPCTCLPTCETPCEGYRSACDCAACKSAYSDAMDYADY